MSVTRHIAVMSASAAALALNCAGAAAQPYPHKPIRFITPNGLGGSTDLVARSIAQKLSEAFGQQVVVDNRPGSGGILGAEIVARAPADGYTLLMGTAGNFAISPHLYKKLAYDPVRDFSPVTQISASAYMLLVHPAIGVRSVKDLVALAKAKPGALNYASAGSGTGSHLSMELFRSIAGINMVHIPYKGGMAGLTEMLAGQVQAMCNGIPSSLPLARANRVRALAVTTARRSAAAPELPTLAEAGYPGAESNSWAALMAPAGTPREVIARLHAEVSRALAAPDVRERLMADGAEPVGSAPAELAAYIQTEWVKWGKVVKQSGARAD